MKSTKFKTLGVCIATLAFLLMAVGSSSSGSSSNSSDSNGATTTTATTTKAATTKKVETVSYSTNDKKTVEDGNKGLYSYKSSGGTYDNYYLIDFDNGYVYNFSDGNGSSTGDRIKIVSGDLNDVLIITYHDVDGSSWSYGLHFKLKRVPHHLILQDKYGTEYDFYETNLKDALKVLSGKTITDYSDSSLLKVDKSDYPTIQPKTEATTSATENTEVTSIDEENTESTDTTSAPETSAETEDLLTMIDVTGVTLDKAKKQLKDVGFSNISEESDNGKVIILDINWTVISQNIEAGTKTDKNTKIILTCSKGENTATTAETTVTTTSDTTKPESSNDDLIIYDISWYNIDTQNKLNTAMAVYLADMLEKLSNQANQNNMKLEEITDWSRFKTLEGSPYPSFSAQVIVLSDTPEKTQLLVENSKAKDFAEYFNSLGKYGFNNGAKSSNWLYIPNPTSGTSFSFIIYKENNKEYGFLQIDKYDMSN